MPKSTHTQNTNNQEKGKNGLKRQKIKGQYLLCFPMNKIPTNVNKDKNFV